MKNAKRFSWSEYFGNKGKVDRTLNGTAFSDTTSTNNYYVFVCNFEDYTEKGAIYIKRGNKIYTLLEDSAFNRCKSTSEGGFVYYDCPQLGHFIQQRNCYFESIANDHMAFYQLVKSSPTNKNYAFDISVSKCGESETKGAYTFTIAFGDVQIKNNNITYNKCLDRSSTYCYLSGKSGYSNFSTFRENNQTWGESLSFYSSVNSYTHTVSYCNVIGNKFRTGSDQVLFDCTYNTTVDHCVFLNNTAAYMFKVYTEGCTLTITDSYVQSNSTTGPGTVKFEKDKSNYDPINISQFSTENCYIEPKVFGVKISYFSVFAQISPALFSSK